MKVVFHPSHLQHRNRGWFQVVVERLAEPKRLPVLFQIDVGDLGCRMYPGIGSACGGNTAMIHLQLAQRLFDSLLNGRHVLLALPARERAAVVLDFHCKARHGRPIAPWRGWDNPSIGL